MALDWHGTHHCRSQSRRINSTINHKSTTRKWCILNFFLLLLTISGTVVGDLLKTACMRQIGPIDDFHPGALIQNARQVVRMTAIWFCLLAYTVSFFSFMALISISDVSFAVPATAAGYVAEILLAKTFLSETISQRRWAGAVLVTCGVMLISY